MMMMIMNMMDYIERTNKWIYCWLLTADTPKTECRLMEIFGWMARECDTLVASIYFLIDLISGLRLR